MNVKTATQVHPSSRTDVTTKTGVWHTIQRIRKSFMGPLTVFAPVQRQQGRGLDWSLTLLAIATFCFQLSIVGQVTCVSNRINYMLGADDRGCSN